MEDIIISNDLHNINKIKDINFEKNGIFIYNALENGWTVTKKVKNSYIF